MPVNDNEIDQKLIQISEFLKMCKTKTKTEYLLFILDTLKDIHDRCVHISNLIVEYCEMINEKLK